MGDTTTPPSPPEDSWKTNLKLENGLKAEIAMVQ
jgi:hypothetical protein